MGFAFFMLLDESERLTQIIYYGFGLKIMIKVISFAALTFTKTKISPFFLGRRITKISFGLERKKKKRERYFLTEKRGKTKKYLAS